MTRHLVARNRRRLVVLPIPLVGATRRANNAQARPPSGGLRGTITFDTWLEQQR